MPRPGRCARIGRLGIGGPGVGRIRIGELRFRFWFRGRRGRRVGEARRPRVRGRLRFRRFRR
ncbi:hypothetical protein PP1_028550 [Pseudonocardia sp. P1]